MGSQMSEKVDPSQTLDIRPIAGALGAEVGGVDLSQDLSDGTIAEIRQALLDHLVIFFRDQNITPDLHLSFAKRLAKRLSIRWSKGLRAILKSSAW